MVCNTPKDPRQKRRGVAAIEFAMVAPLLILLLMGIIVYGGWFWLAHTVQALASESARSAIAGLDNNERELLAKNLVTSQASELGLDPALTTTRVIHTPDSFRVEIVYDARKHPLLALAVIMPKPPTQITRSAAVRLEGY